MEHSEQSARKLLTGLSKRGSSFGKAEELQVEFSISRPSCLSWEELTPLAGCCGHCTSPNLPSTPPAPTTTLDFCLSLLFCLLIFNLSHFRAQSEAQMKKHPTQSYHVLCRHFPQITFSSLQRSLFPWWPLVAAQLAGTKFRISVRISVYWDRAPKPKGSCAKGTCKLQAADPN